LLSDRVALRAEERMRAAAVVQLAWVDEARSRAHLRLHVAETDAWIERTLAFSPADTEPERGRTLGFAVTSMLPEEVLAARSRIMLPRADEAAAPAAAPPPAPAAAPGPPAPPRYAVRLGAAGSTGVSGTAGGIGGTVDGELFFGAAPSLRAGIGYRLGDVPGLGSSDITLSLRGGFALWPLPLSAGWPVAVSVRVDGVAFHHDLSFRSENGQVTRLGRWVAGMDVVAELSIRLTGTMHLVAAAGAEVAFGATDLVIQDIYPDHVQERIVATIPPLRGVGELGLRLLF
jgi:hypothetical protein